MVHLVKMVVIETLSLTNFFDCSSLNQGDVTFKGVQLNTTGCKNLTFFMEIFIFVISFSMPFIFWAFFILFGQTQARIVLL